MKKHSILGLALLVLFAFGAILASTAGAEEVTLLAEWLLNGAIVTTLTSIEGEGVGIIKDNKVPIAGAAAIKCEGIADGSVGPNGEGEVTEILTLALVAVSLGGTELSCPLVEGCEEAGKVAPINLPWHSLLVLVVATPELFVGLAMEGAGKTLPGYEVTCKVFGITQTDTCTVASHSGSMATNGATDVVSTPETVEPNGTCSIGGAGSSVTTVVEGLSLTLTGTLQASSV